MHWFVVRQLERQVLEQLGHTPSTAAAIAVLVGLDQGEVAEQLHAMKMRGAILRDDAGVFSIKKLNGSQPAAPEIKREPLMTKADAPAENKKCPRCQKTKPLTTDGKPNFYSNGYCRECGRDMGRERSEAKSKAAGGGKKAPKKLASKRVAKYQHGVPPDPLGRMVVNLFSIRIKDHAGLDHDLVLDYGTVKQLLLELKDCTS